jgi:predicted MFS family arabinose efflux permease
MNEPLPTSRIVAVAMAGLAAAMGIGRFAFTPLLPLMQADGLGLSQGAWLAGANYLGYLLGALACAARPPSPARAARWGLVAVALSTLAMAPAGGNGLALVLRAVAGVASAFVLVGLSAWALPLLAVRGRADAAGLVYAGVGVGMVVAGGAAIAVALAGRGATAGWWLLGALAAAATVATWRPLRVPVPAPAAPVAAPSAGASTALLVACYGAFGFGYILPATFLPAMARQLIDDPAVFGWTWPVFGAAAAVSTVAGGALLRRLSPRQLWAASHVVMALGVLVPVLVPHSLAALVVSAVCIGGTFMVATMAGLQEARRVAGAAAPRLMAAMTAAFGTGQLIGPLAVGAHGSAGDGLATSAVVAALLLLGSAAVLRTRDAPMPTTS